MFINHSIKYLLQIHESNLKRSWFPGRKVQSDFCLCFQLNKTLFFYIIHEQHRNPLADEKKNKAVVPGRDILMQEPYLVELVGISFTQIFSKKEKTAINMKQSYFKQSWTVGSVVKSTCGSLKRPRFYSKSPPEDSPWFQPPCMHVVHRLTCRKNTYTQNSKSKSKKLFQKRQKIKKEVKKCLKFIMFVLLKPWCKMRAM